jgi:hypothetical protein
VPEASTTCCVFADAGPMPASVRNPVSSTTIELLNQRRIFCVRIFSSDPRSRIGPSP